jgi:hypothetical protein
MSFFHFRIIVFYLHDFLIFVCFLAFYRHLPILYLGLLPFALFFLITTLSHTVLQQCLSQQDERGHSIACFGEGAGLEIQGEPVSNQFVSQVNQGFAAGLCISRPFSE